MTRQERDAHRNSPPIEETHHFSVDFDRGKAPEVVEHVEKLLREDELLRRGVARLMIGMHIETVRWLKERLKGVVLKTIDGL
jgi:hypothetical protein